MKVKLLAHTPEPEKLIAAAAKNCYSAADVDSVLDGLTPEKTDGFLQMLTELGHDSPVEHASFTFAIEGVSSTVLNMSFRPKLKRSRQQSRHFCVLWRMTSALMKN